MALRTEFLDAMSGLVSSVSIVTTDGVAGRAGATVSAMSSVSADGDWPTMLVCLNYESSAAPKVLENGVFCINVLEAGQSDISNVFAGRVKTEDGDKFTCARFVTLQTGAPVLDPALAVFDCALRSSERIGTHFIMLGDVKAVRHHDGEPLLYGQRAYQRLA